MRTTDQDFEDWYRRFHRSLVLTVATSFGDPDLAREVSDEAIVRAYERWAQVAGMESPEGWTYRVAINLGRRRLRRTALERRLLKGGSTDEVPSPASELWNLVGDLPPRQRTAVALRHVAHMTEADIATVMGITRGSVSSTLRAAYRSLRVELTDDEMHKEPLND